MLNTHSLSNKQSKFLLYREVRSALKMPLKIQLYFDLLEHSLTQNIDDKSLKVKQGFSTQFIKGFMKLSKQQRQEFLLANISSLYLNFYRVATIDEVQQQNSQNQNKLHDQLARYDKLENIQGKCQVLFSVLGLPYWKNSDFNLQAKKRMLNLHSSYSTLLDLRMYLPRKSRKHPRTLVLESVSSKSRKQHEKVSLFFKQSSTFQKVSQSIFNSIVSHRNSQLVNQYQKYEQQQQQNQPQIEPESSGIQISVRPLIFLNQKSINDYKCMKQAFLSHLQQLQQTYFPIHKRNEMTISKSSKDSSIFLLQNIFNNKRQEIKQTLITNLPKYSFIKNSQVLQTFSQKYQAIYQKYYLRGRKLDQIIIQQTNQQNTNEVIFIKHVDSVINKSFMEFCIFNIQKLPGSSCKLSIYGCFHPILIGGAHNLLVLLQEYVNIITGQKSQLPSIQSRQIGHSNSVITKDQFFTILDEFQTPLTQNQRQQIHQQIKNTVQKLQNTAQNTTTQGNIENFQLKKPFGTTQKVSPTDKYLFHKYIVSALPKDQTKQRIDRDNWLAVDWKRTKGGGLICKNQTIIQAQRKLYKKVIMSFGEQFIKNKGLLNMSIPVIVFKKQSQLHSMAKTFKMAPYFLEKAVKQTDPVQRFKQVFAGMISINSLNLAFQKPFNPILGQTLQCSVNGCPIYIQQISHHPPITSYYFVGRGYKLYGTAHIKIDIGLNNAKGYSELSHTLQFDNGEKIQFTYPKLLIGGMLFGQRTFNFEGKTWMYDVKNKLYADVYFGQLKKTFFASQSHPEDQVSGKIYTMKPSFDQFYNSRRPIIEQIDKNDIQSEVDTISGIWNTSMKIGQKAYTQFVGTTIDPIYQIEQDEFVLPSDSRYRKDLIYLIQGKIDKAQQHKVEMEQLQRKDKKLRLQYAQKKGG